MPTLLKAEYRPPMPVSWGRIGTPKCSSSERSPLATPAFAGSVTPRNIFPMRSPSPAAFSRGDDGKNLHQGFGRIAGLRDGDETRALKIKSVELLHQRAAVQIVVETHLGPPGPPQAFAFGRGPAGKLRQSLPAEARSACAEEYQSIRANAEPVERLLRGDNVVLVIQYTE